jgi:hypothetical protein
MIFQTTLAVLILASYLAQNIMGMPPSPQAFSKHPNWDGGETKSKLNTSDRVEKFRGAPCSNPVVKNVCEFVQSAIHYLNIS